MRFFNTAGPCLPDRHYLLPPELRLPGAREFIDEGQFFVVHAPRQTGKTTTLAALASELTAGDDYYALRFSCETAEPAGDDYGAAELALLAAIRVAWTYVGGVPPEAGPPDPWPEAPPGGRLRAALTAWAQTCPLPLVLFFDEIDALRGESLRTVLRQLRDGYTARPDPFVHSVVLCGLRDVRDYKAASGGDPTRLGTSSPFNIKVASLRIEDFTAAQLRELYQQHTDETGQVFTDQALALAFDYTRGQPWLTNALAREIVREMRVPPSELVTVAHVEEAKERLILARATHLDSRASKLSEPRVRRVLEPLIAGTLPDMDLTFNDDAAYVRDLGLIGLGRSVEIANPIYREVIVRVLGEPTEAVVFTDPRSFILPDGRLDFRRLLEEFADFWRQHGDVLQRRDSYHEAAPQLVMMGFLHRVVNGGGSVDREYGIGRGRIDLVVRWPYTDGDGKRATQCEPVELKVWRTGRPDPTVEGLRQLDAYLDRLGCVYGTLVVFDRRVPDQPPTERTRFTRDRTPSGRSVTVLWA